MGSVSLKIGDGTARFRRATLCSSALHVVMLVSVLTTNLFALYAFTYAPSSGSSPGAGLQHQILSQEHSKNLSLISEHVSLIVREIESSQKKLTQIERELLGYETLDVSKPNVPPELKLFLGRHPLPLGRDSRTGITEMVSSVGHSCARAVDLLALYMTYKPGGQCPEDASLAQKLVSRGCEPLPRRRCLSKPVAKPGLLPLPESLWKPVSEKIVGKWNGFDRQMWVKPRGKNDFLIDDVLALGGGIRVGFDIGGEAGNFAARMAEKNVTIVSSVLNVGGPVSDFVAARGLFPLFLTAGQRFPFYDSVFDLVHTVNGMDEGSVGVTRPEKMEFFMFDIDRVLRPGGLFWLDNYYCADEKKKAALTALIEKFGYKKLKWVVGEKVDASASGKKVYLSAVLQKPARG
ncbi:hypothetical protein Taro_008595 [Colocasia esculenta]|uniref:Methyltransferase type 11 domain-containing protein n=1 Tax=Colocasia esculenta TaxID=4460 RepID=A0A843TU49_COLES|nr:hypothetical protein [Colocasia esculenta]